MQLIDKVWILGHITGWIIITICSIVGAIGRGPKYLSDEYAVMDTRYWPLDDPTVAWISYVEMAIMIPLCFAW